MGEGGEGRVSERDGEREREREKQGGKWVGRKGLANTSKLNSQSLSTIAVGLSPVPTESLGTLSISTVNDSSSSTTSSLMMVKLGHTLVQRQLSLFPHQNFQGKTKNRKSICAHFPLI